jgi:phosphoadenosine phosphosulfate reductase
MNALTQQFTIEKAVSNLPAEELARSLADAQPAEIIAAALRTVGRDRPCSRSWRMSIPLSL